MFEKLSRYVDFEEEVSVWPIVYSVLVASLSWTLLFALSILGTHEKHSMIMRWRCLSIFHGIIANIIAFEGLFKGPMPFVEPGESNTPLHNLTMVVQLGFYVFDFFFLLYNSGVAHYIMTVHHAVTVVIIFFSLLIQESGAELMVGMLVMEITDPIFQFRGLLRETSYKDGILYKLLEWFFIIVFTIVRLLIGSLVAILIVTDSRNHPLVKIITIVTHVMSILLLYFILAYCKRKYFSKHKVNSKKNKKAN